MSRDAHHAAVQAPAATAARSASQLTNLAHLDFLTDTVDAADRRPGHTTYRPRRANPTVGVLWVYANHQADGSFQRIGGGNYDAVRQHLRAGCLRRRRHLPGRGRLPAALASLTATRTAATSAYQLLRGLTYLQTASGPNAGNVVLWMQPDGTLNPSPTPEGQPRPVRLRRLVLAGPHDLGARRGLRRLPRQRPGVRSLPAPAPRPGHRRARPGGADPVRHLSTWSTASGLPAWLIVDGADASAEAVLGLSAYVRAGGDAAARTALRQARRRHRGPAVGHAAHLAVRRGAALAATSLSMWHAWASQMPEALARAASALGNRQLLAPAAADAAVFTPHLLTATGPDNGWLPAPVDGSQIAYGVDSRRAVAARGRAGDTVSWHLRRGRHRGRLVLRPEPGRRRDLRPGHRRDRRRCQRRRHGQPELRCRVDDPRPAHDARARRASRLDQGLPARAPGSCQRDGQHTVEGESAALSGPASVITPALRGPASRSGATEPTSIPRLAAE